jgi:Protein of unknown function (DUF1572)
MIISSIKYEYLRYKKLAEGAIAQVPDNTLNKPVGENNNSVSILIRHLSGNLRSRFTDFLTSDGEKSWRNRETEFEDQKFTRNELIGIWDEGWFTLLTSLDELTDKDLNRIITIRGKDLLVVDALHRSLAHLCYHVGQIILISRIITGKYWKNLSIPKVEKDK